MKRPVETIPIQFRGLAQHVDAKRRVTGDLEEATNVVIDKRGRLNKRRGYKIVDTGANSELTGQTVDAVFLAVTTYEDEIVIFGYDRLYAVGSQDGFMSTARSVIERGRMTRGNIRRQNVVSSRTGKSSGGLPG